MKKTITSLALVMSTANAFAFIGPHPGNGTQPMPVERTICLNEHGAAEDGSQVAGDCDSAKNNSMFRREIKANGCAEGQVAIKTTSLKVKSCPSFVQL